MAFPASEKPEFLHGKDNKVKEEMQLSNVSASGRRFG